MVNTNYSVGNFLVRVKNAAMAGNKTLTMGSNKYVFGVAEALKKLGYFDDVKKEGNEITVSLSFKDKHPKLIDLKLVSKPGLRVYMGVDELSQKKGPSIYLLSTPKGIVSSKNAIKDRVGGEVIAEIW